MTDELVNLLDNVRRQHRDLCSFIETVDQELIHRGTQHMVP